MYFLWMVHWLRSSSPRPETCLNVKQSKIRRARMGWGHQKITQAQFSTPVKPFLPASKIGEVLSLSESGRARLCWICPWIVWKKVVIDMLNATHSSNSVIGNSCLFHMSKVVPQVSQAMVIVDFLITQRVCTSAAFHDTFECHSSISKPSAWDQLKKCNNCVVWASLLSISAHLIVFRALGQSYSSLSG